MIGSERSIDLALSSTRARNETVRRFQLLLNSIQTTTMRLAQYHWANDIACDSRKEVEDFRSKLTEGISVWKHSAYGKKVKRILSFGIGDRGERLFIEKSKSRSDSNESKGLDLEDITEVRRGINSLAFETCSQSNVLDHKKCLSIIGSERTIDLEFDSHDEMISLCNCLVNLFRLYLTDYEWETEAHTHP